MIDKAGTTISTMTPLFTLSLAHIQRDAHVVKWSYGTLSLKKCLELFFQNDRDRCECEAGKFISALSHVPTVGSQAALKEAILFHCQGLKLNVLESRACRGQT